MQYLWGKSSPRRCFASRAESASWQTGWHFTSGVWGTTGEKQNRQSWQHDELVFKKLEELGRGRVRWKGHGGQSCLHSKHDHQKSLCIFFVFFSWGQCKKTLKSVSKSPPTCKNIFGRDAWWLVLTDDGEIRCQTCHLSFAIAPLSQLLLLMCC